MHRRTLWIFAFSLVCAVVAVVAAVAAGPPNLGKAIEAQRRLATERPQDAGVFNDLGNLLLLANRPKEAEEAYRQAVELAPERVSALFNLGLVLQQRGELREAMDLYERVLKIQPEHAWAHYQVGTIQERRGNESRAVEEYAQAFALDPQLAFPEINPHVVENRLVTEAMLRAYREGYAVPGAPPVYEEPGRIARLLVPPPQQQQPAEAVAGAAQQQPGQAQPPVPAQRPGAPGSTVLREQDLDRRNVGQATPQGSVRRPPAYPGNPQQMNPSVPRGLRQWERPDPNVQEIDPEGRPGTVITPPPGGVYYRPGIQSTGRLNVQVVPDARG